MNTIACLTKYQNIDDTEITLDCITFDTIIIKNCNNFDLLTDLFTWIKYIIIINSKIKIFLNDGVRIKNAVIIDSEVNIRCWDGALLKNLKTKNSKVNGNIISKKLDKLSFYESIYCNRYYKK